MFPATTARTAHERPVQQMVVLAIPCFCCVFCFWVKFYHTHQPSIQYCQGYIYLHFCTSWQILDTLHVYTKAGEV